MGAMLTYFIQWIRMEKSIPRFYDKDEPLCQTMNQIFWI